MHYAQNFFLILRHLGKRKYKISVRGFSLSNIEIKSKLIKGGFSKQNGSGRGVKIHNVLLLNI